MTVYVTGGGGTHLEPRITAYYLVALLAEAGARGVLGRVVAVKTQQSEIDSPLDDLVIDGLLADGVATRLDLQITTTLSFTESDDKWKDIVSRAWATFRRPGFDPATRQLGVAVSQVTTKLERSIQPLLARARHATEAKQYRARLATPKGANEDQREFQRVLDKLIREADQTATDDEIVSFIRCLTIIPFDLDQEAASRDRQAAVDRMALLLSDPDDAPKAWGALNAIASRVIPSGGSVDRAAIARELQLEGYTVGADRSRADLVAALDIETRASLASIRDSIGGRRIARDAIQESLLVALGESRLLRIVGEHGTGKSALLKRLAEDQAAGAPLLVLRDLRVAGGGWAAHSARFGAPTALATLLREFGLAGSRILFIDGIDKMLDPAVHVTINDLIATIAGTAGLEDWRIVITSREENIQRVSGWLDPDALAKLPTRTVRIEGFDDEEAMALATALPSLRPLLSDPQNYDRVLRRPFFLDALSRLPVPEGGEVRSEVDLLELWWQNGGADASDFAPAQGRRNVLRTLGERLLVKPGAPLPVRQLDPVPLDELRRAGVLRDVALGSTVAFSHDIYEEWSLHRVLSERRDEIAQALRDGGQDLQLARPLQLLATELLERADDGAEWGALLVALESAELRATWTRVVLAAPVRSVRSAAMLDRIEPALMRDDGALLGRLVLTVRTTETVRNLRFLDADLIPGLSSDEREQFASQAATPQLLTWMRLLDWLVPRLDSIPQKQFDELYSLLEAWVAYVGGLALPHLHVPLIAAWARRQLGDIDAEAGDDLSRTRGPSGGHPTRARRLLLQAAGAAPDLVRDYLSTISDKAPWRLRKEIVSVSATMAQSMPAETAAFIKRAFLLDHGRSRTRSFSSMREPSETLGFDDDQTFYPASPLRLPFLQLLRAHPAAGLELIRYLCNHAMIGWRRARTSPENTPLPITIDLGDGPAEFWGDDSSYRWFRGGSHVHILDSALMALDAWAHERLKAGDNLDELCRSITSGNQCNAVLGICAGLCLVDLNTAMASSAALALTTHPAVWSWDITRQVADQGMQANEIGYWAGEQHLALALRAHNELPHRKKTIRDLSVGFAAFASPEVRERYAHAIGTFLDRIPFDSVQQRDDPEAVEALRRYFEHSRQQADPANLRTEERDGNTFVWIEPPYAAEEEHQHRLANHSALERVLRLYLWAMKAIETGEPADTMSIREAYEEMVALDEEDLFDVGDSAADLRRHHSQSAVAAAAAILAWHAEPDLWDEAEARCTDVIVRAASMVEAKDALSFRGSMVTGHPPAMAAYGYAALARRYPDDKEARRAILQLAVDPIEKVVESVYLAASIIADADPAMVWRLYSLATFRAAHSQSNGDGIHWSREEATEQLALVEEAEQALDDDILPEANPPTSAQSDEEFSDEIYRWDYLANVFKLPIAPLLAGPTRGRLLASAASMLSWALSGRAEDGNAPPFEWLFAFGEWLGRLLGHLSPGEATSLLFDQVDDAKPNVATETMDTITRSFMIEWMLNKEPLSDSVVAIWEKLVGWAITRPAWEGGAGTERVTQHERGLALSTIFCAASTRLVCGVDPDWPHAHRLMSMIEPSVQTFAIDGTVFAGLLKLVRAQRAQLLPKPGLDWIQTVVRSRSRDREFWEHADNGEQLVILLREVIAAGPLSGETRATILEAADVLIEVGVRGAAFLQQDMVRHGR